MPVSVYDAEVDIDWVNSETLSPEELERELTQGLRRRRRPAASVRAAPRARSRPPGTRARTALPYFGICYGLHMAVIEFARNVCGLTGRQLDRDRPRDAVSGHRPDADQKGVEMGGTMRLGLWPCWLQAGHEGGRRRTANRTSPSGTGIGSRSTTTIRRAAGAGRVHRQRRLAGRQPGRDHGAEDHPFYRRVSSSTPNSAAGRTDHTQSSASSSPRP